MNEVVCRVLRERLEDQIEGVNEVLRDVPRPAGADRPRKIERFSDSSTEDRDDFEAPGAPSPRLHVAVPVIALRGPLALAARDGTSVPVVVTWATEDPDAHDAFVGGSRSLRAALRSLRGYFFGSNVGNRVVDEVQFVTILDATFGAFRRSPGDESPWLMDLAFNVHVRDVW
ncbi:MAG: hypothetical protein LC798_13475 [Chloroflexi bacterium]|nr:hypothetical protein [Chloroflexota bacterium]